MGTKITTCTWKDCTKEAIIPQIGENGEEWANLCLEHAKELDSALSSTRAKRLVRAWALAGSGHKSRLKLSSTITKGVNAIFDIAVALRNKND